MVFLQNKENQHDCADFCKKLFIRQLAVIDKMSLDPLALRRRFSAGLLFRQETFLLNLTSHIKIEKPHLAHCRMWFINQKSQNPPYTNVQNTNLHPT